MCLIDQKVTEHQDRSYSVHPDHQTLPVEPIDQETGDRPHYYRRKMNDDEEPAY
jgi:hypothetical protein